jgi:hypothetical protein
MKKRTALTSECQTNGRWSNRSRRRCMSRISPLVYFIGEVKELSSLGEQS